MSSKLYQALFDLTHCYVSGVPLPNSFDIDNDVRILAKGSQGDCWVAAAIQAENDAERRKNEEDAEQTISQIANIYALVSGFSTHFEHAGSIQIQSRDDLGKSICPLTVSISVQYSQPQLQVHQSNLVKGWQQTKQLWDMLQSRLRDTKGQFLRVALFYHYRSGLPPAIPFEEAFVDAAIGLEALFNESPQDIGYKLATRGALILSCSGEKENYFQTLKGLYNKRNDIVHGKGAKIQTSDYEKIRTLLRKSLRSFLALGLDRDKDDIIKLLDRGLIETEVREELAREILSKSCKLGLA